MCVCMFSFPLCLIFFVKTPLNLLFSCLLKHFCLFVCLFVRSTERRKTSICLDPKVCCIISCIVYHLVLYRICPPNSFFCPAGPGHRTSHSLPVFSRPSSSALSRSSFHPHRNYYTSVVRFRPPSNRRGFVKLLSMLTQLHFQFLR